MTFCSLIVQTSQLIQPNTYTALRFDTESADGDNLHASKNLASQNSALIIPKSTGVGLLAAEVFWENATTNGMETIPTQYLYRFTRDPFTEDIDSTCTHDRAPTPGAQFEAFTWPITVRIGQPLAVMVGHNGSAALNVTLGEFKLWIP